MKEEKRKVDILFDEYTEHHQNPTNKFIQWIGVPLMVFGIIGLVTAIPFPHIGFLGKYNMYINWFSFLMAACIYYYVKLSPLLSYLMLFFFGACYYFIVQLEYVEKAGGPALWQVSLGVFLFATLLKFIGYRMEGKTPSFLTYLKFMLIGPVWLFSIVLNKLKIRY